MEKAIFSITCTTCHARLAVRSEAAIGTILECPKCESMVHIVPPEGWSPAQSPGQEPLPTDSTAPPPLDRVSETPLTLELDPATNSLLGRLFQRLWILWGSAFVAVAVVVWGLWSLLAPSQPPPESAALTSERPATAGYDTEQPSSPPGPQSGGVQSPDNAADDAAAGKNTSGPSSTEPPTSTTETPSIPSSPSATEPSAKSEPAAAEPTSLFPPAAENDAEEDSPPIEIRKLPPPPVDVAARLADPLAEIELNDVPLIGVMDLLSSMSTVPITLDADALAQLGVAPRDRVTLRLGSTTIGDALRTAAAKRGLSVAIDGGGLIVTAPADYRETPRKIRYTVSDLAGEDQAALEKLATMICNLVAPQSWRGNGGEGSIEPEGNALLVVQTGDVHRRILIFCEKLRNARHLPLRSREDPRLFTPATRADRARKTLDRPATVNFHEPAPLARILAYLSQATGADILVDRAALALADTSDQVEATLTAQKQRLGEALTALLRPLGLTYRIVGDELIQVTTEEAAEERLELEFHPIGLWLDRGIQAERLAEQLKARVAPVSWSDVGGEADIYFDAPSGCLIVLQSQPAQATIQQLLATPPDR
ncbi:MAG: hypothetical protein KKA28_17510 [Planctomycetes bacterium]|nr:hypothetical protein [Planctomycetota bacterium]MCG2685060.1 hypothetical protein [Planctomycetales bacterium]